MKTQKEIKKEIEALQESLPGFENWRDAKQQKFDEIAQQDNPDDYDYYNAERESLDSTIAVECIKSSIKALQWVLEK